MRQLKYELTSGYMVGLRVEYPVIRTVEGKVVGMCLDADSPYLHAMVAAPEMLEALKSCVQIESDVRRLDARYGYEIPQSWQDAFSMIKAAIAKAEGRGSHETP